MNRHHLPSRLRDGRPSIGSWLTIPHPTIAEIAAQAGFEWLVVDLEHTSIGIDEAAELIRVIDLCGTVPLVRLTSHDASQIKRVLDAGAGGILVPMVNDAGTAAEAVAATRYAPSGTRGVGLARAQRYGVGFREYVSWHMSGIAVIVQIEHVDALPHLEEIFSVDGVSGFIVGPYDLSASMGYPGEFQHPEFKTVLSQILNAGRRAECPAGYHLVEPNPDELGPLFKAGYSFVAYSVDMRFLDVSARLGVEALSNHIDKAGAPAKS